MRWSLWPYVVTLTRNYKFRHIVAISSVVIVIGTQKFLTGPSTAVNSSSSSNEHANYPGFGSVNVKKYIDCRFWKKNLASTFLYRKKSLDEPDPYTRRKKTHRRWNEWVHCFHTSHRTTAVNDTRNWNCLNCLCLI